VPFEPGRLQAVARRGGSVVARDAVVSAGKPSALRLRVDPRAGWGSLAYVTADVVDRHRVVVPGADNLISWGVSGGGWIAGLDNGREEDPEGFKGTAHTAFNGKALAIVHGGRRVTATAPGLRSASTTLPRAAHRDPGPARPPAQAVPRFETPAADASYSGAQDTIPAAMLDGDLSTGWSNFYVADATALLPEISRAHGRDWVSVSTPVAQRRDRLTAYFTVDAHHALPAAIDVRYWDGRRYVPVHGLHVDRATGSNEPTTITFDPVETTKLQLELTSAAPGTDRGFVRIAELR
jgi:beta-galactosidase